MAMAAPMASGCHSSSVTPASCPPRAARRSRLQEVQPALIIVRFDAETATITAAWRLIDARSGMIYNIRTAADMERRRRFITMLCEAGVAT